MADDVRVIRQTTEQLFDETGKPVENIRVEFKVGDDGPFYRRFPVAGFNGFDVVAKLEEFARELRTVKSR